LNVVGALRQEASYIQIHASQNLAMLLTSGFNANSINRAQSPLPQPVIELVENYQTTQLLLRVAEAAAPFDILQRVFRLSL
jgi:hypothetical protein